MEPETLKWLASLGVGGVLAGIMFLVYRKDAAQWQEAWKGQSQMLMQVVMDNSKVIATLVTKMDERRRGDNP